MDEILLMMLRRTAWQRAKGELNAILEFFMNDDSGYYEMKTIIGEFIEKVDKDSPIS
jgi:hypothetical protein